MYHLGNPQGMHFLSLEILVWRRVSHNVVDQLQQIIWVIWRAYSMQILGHFSRAVEGEAWEFL